MIFKYIINFFTKNNYGYFRNVFLVPFISLFIGSIIIFMTFSIMNSLENDIKNRVESFLYKYNYCPSGNLSIDEEATQYSNEKNQYTNSGVQKISFIKNQFHETAVETYLFNDYHVFKNRISSFIIDDLNKEGIIIGDGLAGLLNAELGDTLELFYPTEMNIATSYIPNEGYVISSIYSFDLFDYDNRYVFLPKKTVDNILIYNDDCYYSDAIINDNHDSAPNLLIEAINLEKKIYTSLSFVVIIVCCIIIFNIMSMVMIDKQNQFFYIKVLGISNKRFYAILLIFNASLSFLTTFLGFITSSLIIFINYNFNLFSFIFDSLPFKIVPFSGSPFDYFILYIVINILIVLFSTLPYKLMRTNS